MTRGGHALSRGPPNPRGTQMFVFFVYVCFVFGTLMVIRLLNVASCEICAVEEVARLTVAGYFQISISSFFFSNFVYFLILIS